MKKILVMALAAVSALAVNAKDYTVYSNGALSEGVNANYWWNLTQNTQAQDPAGSDAKTWSLTFAASTPTMRNLLAPILSVWPKPLPPKATRFR